MESRTEMMFHHENTIEKDRGFVRGFYWMLSVVNPQIFNDSMNIFFTLLCEKRGKISVWFLHRILSIKYWNNFSGRIQFECLTVGVLHASVMSYAPVWKYFSCSQNNTSSLEWVAKNILDIQEVCDSSGIYI